MVMKCKNIRFNNQKIKKLAKKGACLALCTGLCFVLSSCDLEPPVEQSSVGTYDIIDTVKDGIDSEGLTQALPIDGETFRLIVHYSVDMHGEDKWHITVYNGIKVSSNREKMTAKLMNFILTIIKTICIC